MGFLPDPLHPAIIHFPIALALVALLFEVLARRERWRSLENAGAVLIVLAALGAVAAVVTGGWARDEAVVPPGVRAILDRHDDIGQTAMWVLLGVAALRLVLGWARRYRGAAVWMYLALMAVAAGLVAYNGHLGGEMVFHYGLGTAPVQHGTPPPAVSPAPPR